MSSTIGLTTTPPTSSPRRKLQAATAAAGTTMNPQGKAAGDKEPFSLKDEAEELQLVADMLSKLSASEKGLTAGHGEQLARRLRTVATRISKNVNALQPPYSVSPHRLGALNTGGVEDGEGGLSGGVGQAGAGSIGPSSSRYPSVGATMAGRCGKPSSSATVSLQSRRARPIILRPSSLKVTEVPREAPLASGPAASREVTRSIACTLYNILESATALTHAQSGHIFVHMDDEMVSVVNVSARLRFPPTIVRHMFDGSVGGGVLASGIALNQSVRDPGRPPTSTLLFPVYPPSPHGHTVGVQPMAVLQLENKYGGRGKFTELDETVTNAAAMLIGELLHRFPSSDVAHNFYDPINQHAIAPFTPATEPPSVLQGSEMLTAFLTEASGQRVPVREALEKYVLPQLVRRERLPLSLSGNERYERVVGLSASPSLCEVDTYLTNLHSCWKSSVSQTMEQTTAERQRQHEMKALRGELLRLRSREDHLSEEVRLLQLDGSDYKNEYQLLKHELEIYLKKKERLV